MIKKRITFLYGSCPGGKEESLTLGRDGSPSRPRGNGSVASRDCFACARHARRASPTSTELDHAVPLFSGRFAGTCRANLFSLAFGLAPEENRASIAEWLADRGIACSVYAARVELPRVGKSSSVFRHGQPVKAPRVGDRWVVDREVKGTVTFEVRKK